MSGFFISLVLVSNIKSGFCLSSDKKLVKLSIFLYASDVNVDKE